MCGGGVQEVGAGQTRKIPMSLRIGIITYFRCQYKSGMLQSSRGIYLVEARGLDCMADQQMSSLV